MAYDVDNIAVSSIRWIGIHKNDFGLFRIPDSAFISLTEQDKSKCRSMLQRPTLSKNKEWLQELQSMLDSGKKAEIECLAYHSLSFLTETYIPTKIAGGCWL